MTRLWVIFQLMLSVPCQAQRIGCLLQSPEKPSFKDDGDVLIGGLIPVHIDFHKSVYNFTEPHQQHPCPAFSVLSYGWIQSLVFAVMEINKNQSFLPNVTLGFLIYDTCLRRELSLHGTIQILTGQKRPILNYQCNSWPRVAATLGDIELTSSVAIARLLGLYRHIQVSPTSTDHLLSDKNHFPSFFRTVPSDNSQAYWLAQLMLHFGWTWVGILSTEDDYGTLGSQVLSTELLKAGVCIEFHKSLPTARLLSKILLITKIVMSSSAHVIVIFSSDPYLTPLMKELLRQNITGKLWVASDGWATSPILLTEDFADLMKGTIGLTTHMGQIPGFYEFLMKIHPFNLPNDIFVRLFWEQAMGCHWPNQESYVALANGDLIKTTELCTGAEKLVKFSSKYYDEFNLRTHYNIYNAVYAVAHAVQSMIFCIPGHGPFVNNTCADLRTFKSWQLLHYMKMVHFTHNNGEEIYFDEHGSFPSNYDIVNWQRKPNGSIHYVKVGTIDGRSPRGQEFSINRRAIQWNLPGTEVPRSVCSESCPSGFWKAAREGHPSCCFDCNPCSEGEISNETESSTCWLCPVEQWPNENRNACLPKEIEFLSYQEPMGATLTSAAFLNSLLTVAIFCIFLKHRDTAIVKANNRDLSYLLLGSLVFSFLCSLLFIGVPQPITCLFRQSAFGIIFVLCVSCVLAKTIMVVIAFNATKPGSNMRKWLGPQVPVVTISVGTLTQVIICSIWLLFCTPFPERIIKMKTGVLIFQCNECSETAFWCMMGYMGMLACVSFLVAFLVRKLPDSFNEAKWITFSMLVFLSVWLSFVPGYLSTQGKLTVAVEVFAILSSNAGLLSCIFFPKCYIILLRPERNAREHLFSCKTISSK